MSLNELHHTTTIVLPGRPVPWTRTGGNGRRRYTPPRYGAWKQEMAWAAKLAHRATPINEPVAVVVFIATDGVIAQVTPLVEWAGMIAPPPSDRPKHVRGDIDNYLKAVNDSLQGLVFTDDRLVSVAYVQWIDSIHDVLDVPKNGNDT